MHQFINASLTNPSLIKGAWLLLLETDYVWMKPLPSPGDAYDTKVPGWSFAFDYIAPRHPGAEQSHGWMQGAEDGAEGGGTHTAFISVAANVRRRLSQLLRAQHTPMLVPCGWAGAAGWT